MLPPHPRWCAFTRKRGNRRTRKHSRTGVQGHRASEELRISGYQGTKSLRERHADGYLQGGMRVTRETMFGTFPNKCHRPGGRTAGDRTRHPELSRPTRYRPTQACKGETKDASRGVPLATRAFEGRLAERALRCGRRLSLVACSHHTTAATSK